MFLIGMSTGNSCGGVFGLTVVDTYDNTFKIYHFPIQKLDSYDNYDAIVNCFASKGVSGCYELAQVWSSIPI